MEKHFTVTTYILNRGRVLLIFHEKLQKWIAVGGHLEKNETPDECALREVEEETGLRVKLLSPCVPPQEFEGLPRPEGVHLFRIPKNKKDDEHFHVDLIYFAEASTDQVRIGDGVKEHRWVSLQDLNTLGVEPQVRYWVERLLR